MINIISEVFIQFGERAVSIFGFPIYYYALLIVLGMCLGMLVASYLMKKSKLDGFSVVDYCVWLLPLGILGARLYFFIFPYNGKPSDWSEFFNFRNGGLGIYGGVILGYITCYIIARVKKHNFFKITDCMLPGVLLAQAIGRWGNFVNQEAFGNIITNTSLQWFPYGVYIESLQEWHQATFFYESVCTFLGFIICLILFNNKHYRTGWTTAFYGIYYGIVRLVIESMRTDSLYLWLGTYQTNIKISQAVSVITIVLGVWKLTVIYRSELLKFYRSRFNSKVSQLNFSFWLLLALCALSVIGSIALFVVGGDGEIISGIALLLVAAYTFFGMFAVKTRVKLYFEDADAYGQLNADGTAEYNGVIRPATSVSYAGFYNKFIGVVYNPYKLEIIKHKDDLRQEQLEVIMARDKEQEAQYKAEKEAKRKSKQDK